MFYQGHKANMFGLNSSEFQIEVDVLYPYHVLHIYSNALQLEDNLCGCRHIKKRGCKFSMKHGDVF